jgi:hypothetical protein
MNWNIKRYSKPTFAALLLLALVSAIAAFARQNLMNTQHLKAKDKTTFSDSLKLEVEHKSRYFFGETPTIKIAITNKGRSPQTVKEAEYHKFSLEMTGIFENASEQQKLTRAYDGSWDIPKPTRSPLPGETHEWLALKKREPKFVKLAPGESTSLELNLSKTFGAYLGVGKYKLIVKSEDGQKVVKEFEVYFDDEKSVAFLAGYLKADNEQDRIWAAYRLAEFNREKLIVLLEELVKSGNEKQRDFANEMLTRTKTGGFDYLKLRVENKDRYFLGEAPILAISIVNGGSTVQTVKQARYQQFSLELVGTVGSDGKQETKTCVYDGNSQDTSKQTPKAQAQQNSKVVRLSELESTSLSLNLFECFHSQFGIGKYQLIVKSADEQLRHQTVVKKFEVHVEKTAPGKQ